jgi:hypothetical protein
MLVMEYFESHVSFKNIVMGQRCLIADLNLP